MKHQLLTLAALLACVLYLQSCSAGNSDQQNDTTATADQPTDDATPAADPAPADQAVETGQHKDMKYMSCAVYAGATDYEFQDASGESILIRVSHFDEEGPQPDVPKSLVQEVTDDMEGPPDANPEMVGRMFRIHYDEQGGVDSVSGPLDATE